jgi:hypothetical protein
MVKKIHGIFRLADEKEPSGVGRALAWLGARARRLRWRWTPELQNEALELAIRRARWGRAREALDAGPLPAGPELATLAYICMAGGVPADIRRRTLSQCVAEGRMKPQEAGKLFEEAAGLSVECFEDMLAAQRGADGKPWSAAAGDGFLSLFCRVNSWMPEQALRILKHADHQKWREKWKQAQAQARVDRDWLTLDRAGDALSSAYKFDGAKVQLAFAQAFPETAKGDADSDLFPLIEAAKKQGGFELGKLLLAQGADARQVESGGFTALMHAAHQGELELVELLAPLSDLDATPNNATVTAWGCALGDGAMDVALALEKLSRPSQEAVDAALETVAVRAPEAWRQAFARCLPEASAEGVANAAAIAGERGNEDMLRELLPRLDPALAFAAALKKMDESQTPEMEQLAKAWALSWRERQALLEMPVQRGAPVKTRL